MRRQYNNSHKSTRGDRDRSCDCDDDDLGVRRVGIVAGPHHARVGPVDRARLEHVERDARCFLIGDVDHDDVGQLFVRHPARHSGADVPRPIASSDNAILLEYIGD